MKQWIVLLIVTAVAVAGIACVTHSLGHSSQVFAQPGGD